MNGSKCRVNPERRVNIHDRAIEQIIDYKNDPSKARL